MAIPHMALGPGELKNDEKRAITPVFSLHLTSISYSFWNKGWKVFTFLKFYDKRAITSRWVIRFTLKLLAR